MRREPIMAGVVVFVVIMIDQDGGDDGGDGNDVKP